MTKDEMAQDLLGYDYVDGRNARRHGIKRDDCPHRSPRDDRRKAWLEGWDERKDEETAQQFVMFAVRYRKESEGPYWHKNDAGKFCNFAFSAGGYPYSVSFSRAFLFETKEQAEDTISCFKSECEVVKVFLQTEK